MKSQLNEVQKLQKIAGLSKKAINEEADSDMFWDISNENEFEKAISAFKAAGFSIEDVNGFIESHWDRF